MRLFLLAFRANHLTMIVVTTTVLQLAAWAWIAQHQSQPTPAWVDPSIPRGWDATAILRTFPPLLTACGLVSLLSPPFGAIERTANPAPWRLRFKLTLALSAIFIAVLMIVPTHAEAKILAIRNLMAFLGVAWCVSRAIRPTLTWLVLLPLWTFIFMWESSYHPERWPNVLFAWPLSRIDNIASNILCIALLFPVVAFVIDDT